MVRTKPWPKTPPGSLAQSSFSRAWTKRALMRVALVSSSMETSRSSRSHFRRSTERKVVMDAKELPARPSLEQYKKQAKDLVKAFKGCRASAYKDPGAIQRIKWHHPRLGQLPEAEIRNAKFALGDAQLVIAREHGFESWPKFAKHLEALARERTAASLDNPRTTFIEAACVPRDSGHASGTLELAEAILAAHPEVARSDIHTAAILGDDVNVRRFLALG